ncbi:gamma-glutamyltransferase [Deinococcus peraridilitoris]|uniref:Glutathione hydrolase proenzyme n=1 Tax=Deinococcus peraridilitoris (strain DSM 19664 / LMG 22246 / CIP 109416 / KR-200) TaxID=937777 RepID=K9ZY76_DEIPD|nr:gamma-glutamyltransferase [Deinococcus peraridilitoris]AFZ66556.1 gamma-glutamyltranspeptidase [Deinococcus peraridilitoris DSM 19664]
MTSPNGPRTGRPPTYAPRGVVATSHHLASSAGLRALSRGGSAVDAAIAANAVLCVAYPHMAGLGGDGFWLIHDPRQGGVQALNASGGAAALASREYYAERGHRDRIPSRGPLAALTVPGAVDGWHQVQARHGRLPWAELFEDAILLARGGVPVGRSLADWLVQDRDLLREHVAAGRIFLPGGQIARAGEKLVQEDLARSFELLAREGARGAFYEGELAERLCAGVEAGGSPLRPADFANFQAEWTQPVSTTYRGKTVYEFPPNTQGFVALQLLNLLEGYDVRAWGDGSADYYHHIAEAVKLAFADRDHWLTDPKFLDIPLERLTSKAYADERRTLISSMEARDMASAEPGERGPHAARRRSPEGDTCAFCAVDEDGLAVSVIQSIYHDFGSLAVGGDTGILLQNRGSFFSLDPEHPNTLESGKRTFHTLIPAMMFDGSDFEMAFGTMGGEGQPQTHVALLTRLIDFGYDVQQAIEAPRWLMGRTWGTASQDLSLEGRIGDEVARELLRRGQPVKMLTDWNDNMGHAQAIRRTRHGFLEGGADPRGDGSAAGY